MKSRKQVWIAALCLCSAIAIAVAFTVRTTHVQAAKHVAQLQGSRTTIAQPAVYLASPSLRGVMMDDDGPVRVGSRTIFPPVEEFTLTPPNPAAGIDKTILTARFPEAQAAKLASSIPMTLAKQNVILRRSSTASNVFVTTLDFNWQRFMEEQSQRKIAASQGRTVAIFNGRKYVRTEKMQFVDPAQIQQALQSHQPIQFTPDMLQDTPNFDVYPDHELMITNKAVVEDVETPGQGRTFDECLTQNPGNPIGAWTFNTLMTAIACSGNPNCTVQPSQTNQQIAENMLLSMLNNFHNDQTVNTFTVLSRDAIGNLKDINGNNGAGMLANWTIDQAAQMDCTWNNGTTTGPSTCPSLPMAPVRLDAIVNRIDLGQDGDPPFPQSGELRFVFSVTIDHTAGDGICSNSGLRPSTFNIILEYNVPDNIDPTTWATNWIGLQNHFVPSETNPDFKEGYLIALNAITNQVVMANECTNGTSCIAQIRTNELLLGNSHNNGGFWEQREFLLNNSGGAPTFVENTVAQTPDPKFNTLGAPKCGPLPGGSGVNDNEMCTMVNVAAQYINGVANESQFQNTNGAAPPVPKDFPNATTPFRGGSALQVDSATGTAFWNDTGITVPETNRVDFSFNTCNGCHGLETASPFVQVNNRQINTESQLSSFLVGCTSGGSCTPTGGGQCSTALSNMNPQNGNPNACTESVSDPTNPAVQTMFGDLLHRVGYLATTCGMFNSNNQCTGSSGSDILLPFTNKPVGVH